MIRISDYASNDPRDREAARDQPFKSFDEAKMEVTIVVYDDEEDIEEDVTFPAHFEVCGLCNGRGSHVNPSIDAHGISANEFYEDPDFYEDYRSGVYDVPCYRCGGKRVEPVVSEGNLSEAQQSALALHYERLRDQAEWERESYYERLMGA